MEEGSGETAQAEIDVQGACAVPPDLSGLEEGSSALPDSMTQTVMMLSRLLCPCMLPG